MNQDDWNSGARDFLHGDLKRRDESSKQPSELREARTEAEFEVRQLATLALDLIRVIGRLEPKFANAVAEDELSRFEQFVGSSKFPNLRDVLEALKRLRQLDLR